MKQFFETYKHALILILQGAIFAFVFSNSWIFYIGLAISFLAFIYTPFLVKLTQIEEYVAERIAKIVNVVLLAVVYILFFLPIGLIKKLTSRKKEAVGFVVNEKEYSPKDLLNPW